MFSLARRGLPTAVCDPAGGPSVASEKSEGLGKGIEGTLWPIVGESILTQRAALLCPGEPQGAMGRLLCGKEIHLCPAEDVPDVEDDLRMKPPLPRRRLATGE
jgi:hypothetical protein